jgi:hypothetical protein
MTAAQVIYALVFAIITVVSAILLHRLKVKELTANLQIAALQIEARDADLKSAKQNLEAKDLDLQIAQLRVSEAQARLHDAQIQLEMARNLHTVENIRAIMDDLECFPGCVEAACLRVYTTTTDATYALERLAKHIKDLPSGLNPVIHALQTRCFQFINEGARHLAATEGTPHDVYRHALRCYALLVPNFLSDAVAKQAAVDHCKRWLDSARTQLKRATLHALMPALLAHVRESRLVLLSAYKEIMRQGLKSQLAADDEDTVAAAINLLPHLGCLDSSELADIIEVAFESAQYNWGAFGGAWSASVSRCLQNPAVKQDGRCRAFAGRLASYIGAEEAMLTRPENVHKYNVLVTTMLEIRDDHQKRPQNRAIVDTELVLVDVRIPGEKLYAENKLINVSCQRDAQWTPGAFVQSLALNAGEKRQWRKGEVKFSRANNDEMVADGVEIWGPERQPSGLLGYRIKFTPVVPHVDAFLADIVQKHPNRR